MLKRLTIFLLLAVIKMCCSSGLQAQCTGNPINLTFNMDSCDAVGGIAPADYSEFVPVIEESSGVRMTMVSNSLYRTNPTQHTHSCTEGRNETPAICITAYDFCDFQASNHNALKFEIAVEALTNESARLEQLSFYQLAPEFYQWLSGPSGLNNVPWFFGVRILRDGVEVFRQVDIPTGVVWTQSVFNFSDDPNFKVADTAIFSFELLAYCPTGIIAPYSIWDIEDIQLTAVCELTCDDMIDGGIISAIDHSTDTIAMCNQIAEIALSTTSQTQPANYNYILTDESGLIIESFNSAISNVISFDHLASGVYFIYGISDATGGTITPGTLISSLGAVQCQALSTNFITVDRRIVEPGVISGGPFRFCVGDGEADIIPDDAVTLTGAQGETQQWVLTDETGELILALPNKVSDIDFENTAAGNCVLWNVSYSNVVDELIINQPFTCIVNCMKRSNAISIQKTSNEAGVLTGDQQVVCIEDNQAAQLAAGSITITGNTGVNNRWLFTTEGGEIISITDDYTILDLSTLGHTTTLIWHISYDGSIDNLESGLNLTDLNGCYSLSNAYTIPTEQVRGGTITGGPFEFCVQDDLEDYIVSDAVVLSDNRGSMSTWITTDNNSMVTAIANGPSEINFDLMATGQSQLWHLSHNNLIAGLEVGVDLSTLSSCFVLSNAITISNYNNTAATLSGGPFEFCVQDGEEDFIDAGAITANGQTGSNNTFIITSSTDLILSVSSSFSMFDFDTGDYENYKILHLTYDGIITGLIPGSSLSMLDGCYSISNAITVTRNDCRPPISGGTLTGGPYSFCRDNAPDYPTNINLTGTVGSLTQWVVADSQGNIFDLPTEIDTYNLESHLDSYTIYNISYEPGLSGLDIGNNISNDLQGEYALSNAIQVTSFIPNGGTIIGGTYTFCVGDNETDLIPDGDIMVQNSNGSLATWLITDSNATTIYEVIDNPYTFDFDGIRDDLVLIWRLSHEGNVGGLTPGGTIDALTGCYNLSNGLPITTNFISGGDISGGPFYFCTADGEPDIIANDAVTLTNDSGGYNQWVITNGIGTEIIALPSTLDEVNFDNFNDTNFLLWNVSSSEPTTSLQVGGSFSLLGACIAKSNFIFLLKVDNNGGAIETNYPLEFCVGDGTRDSIPTDVITLTGNAGNNSQWMFVDEQGIILNLPLGNYSAANIDNFGAGTCYLYHMSYDGPLTGFGSGQPLADLGGCYDLSNALTVTKTECIPPSPTLKQISYSGLVEIKNDTEEDLDLSAFAVYTLGSYTSLSDLAMLCHDDMIIAPGDSAYFQHDNLAGLSGGELAVVKIIDNESEPLFFQYVKWGNPQDDMSTIATELGLWTEGDTAYSLEDGMSIQFDGAGITAADWSLNTTTSCLSSNNELATLTYTAYPNPVSGILTIELPESALQRLQIQVTSHIGQVLRHYKYDNSSKKVELDLSELNAGVYTLKLSSGNQSATHKVIKI